MTAKYEMVAGLEVHCQLSTRSKLFCSCAADGFGQAPNSRVCPVCTGQPGALPVLNREAVELAFKAALALGCEIAPVSVFARKNYFYPDLPKAYQISQYERPFASGGALELRLKDGVKRVRLERIHLEEDAGKLLHAIGARELDGTLVDFNRGGLPLIEIVSRPDLRSPEQATAFLAALKEVLQYAGVSRCDMEKGELRCDANISVRLDGSEALGTRAEIKNLNSFKGVKDALDYEFHRQADLLESGGRVVQETRLWSLSAMATAPMRLKEEAHDYRYFPDPDLTPLKAEAAWIERLKKSLPELPAARRARFLAQYRLSLYDAEVLTAEKMLADRFDREMEGRPLEYAKPLVNLMTTEFLARLNAGKLAPAQSPIPEGMLSELVGLAQAGVVSSKLEKEVFARMWETSRAPGELVDELGLRQVSDEGPIRAWIAEALAADPESAEDLRRGKQRALGALVGAVMRLSKGKANPALVNRLIKEAVRS